MTSTHVCLTSMTVGGVMPATLTAIYISVFVEDAKKSGQKPGQLDAYGIVAGCFLAGSWTGRR